MLLRFLTLWSFNFKKFLSLIIKLLHLVFQVSIPCKKRTYRLFGKEGYPLVDIMTGENEPPPKVKKKKQKGALKDLFCLKRRLLNLFFFWIFKVGERLLCRHPFNESKRAYVVPQRVEELLKCYWRGNAGYYT